jgi:hypothetical protein
MFADVSLVSGYSRVVALTEAWPLVARWPDFMPCMVLLFVLARVTASVALHLLVWVFWLPRGQDVLFVYSDSPVWHDYIEAEILPNIRRRAVPSATGNMGGESA